eukprot:CAMPEP_0204500588 /NCGR_PEP_ID=MMETSP0471-20130131/97491_1 /ASSEMBLY_ACC=CAM_ASM_000602 /TAXON_ID=2969 /ORGANISM="Oxyrrhis marina" /LENGTH=159 /DNA_ID=CAMNT_0051505215 /DNA_START=26 /DNA_END=503 /DNA_ORIENTATION=-
MTLMYSNPLSHLSLGPAAQNRGRSSHLALQGSGVVQQPEQLAVMQLQHHASDLAGLLWIDLKNFCEDLLAQHLFLEARGCRSQHLSSEGLARVPLRIIRAAASGRGPVPAPAGIWGAPIPGNICIPGRGPIIIPGIIIGGRAMPLPIMGIPDIVPGMEL